MTTLINSLLALPGVRIAIFVILGILALLYILSIIPAACHNNSKDRKG